MRWREAAAFLSFNRPVFELWLKRGEKMGTSERSQSFPKAMLSYDPDGDMDDYIDEYGDDDMDGSDNGNVVDEGKEELEDVDELFELSIDSFLRGEYDCRFADNAPAPHPGLTPQTTVESALRSLRQLDAFEPSHGAAVLMRFCSPLSRNERWGDSRGKLGAWKEILRGAITPTMLARRLRASNFSCLLDWDKLDVSEGAYSIRREDGLELGVPSSVAYVNAALFFGDNGVEPNLVQFTLRKINGVWLIDSAQLSQQDLFVEERGDNDKKAG
jgi:hypothetical protein